MPLLLDQEATVLLLVFARAGTMLMLMPMLGDEPVPRTVRLLLALGLCFALGGLLRPALQPLASAGDVQLAALVLMETVTGLALGMLARLFFQAASMAGAIVSLQSGLTSAIVFDPMLGGQTPILGKLIGLGAVLLCFSLGLHQWWFRGLVDSYASFPPGRPLQAGDWLTLAVTTASRATTLAVSLAAPFLVFGILFNVALGFAARLAPAIQIFFIAQPLLIAGGIALLAVTAAAILAGFGEAYGEWLSGGWATV